MQNRALSQRLKTGLNAAKESRRVRQTDKILEKEARILFVGLILMPEKFLPDCKNYIFAVGHFL